MHVVYAYSKIVGGKQFKLSMCEDGEIIAVRFAEKT